MVGLARGLLVVDSPAVKKEAVGEEGADQGVSSVALVCTYIFDDYRHHHICILELFCG